MLNYKVPAYYLLFLAVLSSLGLYEVLHSHEAIFAAAPQAPAVADGCDAYQYTRLQGYKYIKPLVGVHSTCESGSLTSVKTGLVELIQSGISSGKLKSASFYLHDLRSGDWTAYNENEKFSPGSLMKVQIMMTVLRMAENKPGLLDKEVIFEHSFDMNVQQNFPDERIQVGHRYPLKELLRRMITFSDNDAAMLICENLDAATLQKTFTDFGFRQADLKRVYPITCLEYSEYMEILYNAGYLNTDDSEYATDLLTSCTFKEGIRKGIPDSISIAHKFGEFGTDSYKELHESGIVYYKDSPYLLTIMTRGTDMHELSDMIGSISRVIYTDRASQYTRDVHTAVALQ